jgi:hypothetical protein
MPRLLSPLLVVSVLVSCGGGTTPLTPDGSLYDGSLEDGSLDGGSLAIDGGSIDGGSVDDGSLDGSLDDGALTLDASPTPDAFLGPTDILTVEFTGNGAGTVVSSPPGINCPTVCSAPFPVDSDVTLTATPASGAKLRQWFTFANGSCSWDVTNPTCSLRVDGPRSITALFVAPVCDDFSSADSSTIPGWTEVDGDWAIDGQRLRNRTVGGGLTHIISRDGVVLYPCGRITALASATTAIEGVGVVLGYRPADDGDSYILAMVEKDEGGAGFDAVYVWEQPAFGGQLVPLLHLPGAYGASPILDACVTDKVTVRIDANQDGIFETSSTVTPTTDYSVGRAGVLTYASEADLQPFADDVCFRPTL